MSPKFWWYVTRSTGMVAWGVAAASVLWGLLLSTRSARKLLRPVWVLDLHRFLGGLTVVVVIAHLAALVADSFVHFGAADLLVPGASSYKTTGVALGIVAFWLLALVEVTSLLRRRLSKRTWATIHLASYLVYAAATYHYLLVGTERTNPAMLLVVEITSAAVLFFTILRILLAGGSARNGRRAAVRPTPRRDIVGVGGGE